MKSFLDPLPDDLSQDDAPLFHCENFYDLGITCGSQCQHCFIHGHSEDLRLWDLDDSEAQEQP